MFQAVRTSQIYVNEPDMRASGYTFEDIARYVLHYTKGQGAADPSTLSADERDDPVFSTALPIDLLSSLECLPEARA